MRRSRRVGNAQLGVVALIASALVCASAVSSLGRSASVAIRGQVAGDPANENAKSTRVESVEATPSLSNHAQAAVGSATRATRQMLRSALKRGQAISTSIGHRATRSRAVRLEHGTIVEGSARFGGIQPDYIIDLEHPALKALLDEAQSWRGKSRVEKIRRAQRLVKKTLANDSYDAPGYLALLETYRQKLEPISIGEYARCGAGVCRENAIIGQILLRAAGEDARYHYVHLPNERVDHAVVLLPRHEGARRLTSFDVVDFYFKEKAVSYSEWLDINDGAVVPLTYPKVWQPVFSNAP